MVSSIFIASCALELMGMAVLTCEIPDGLSKALEARLSATRESVSRFVSRVLQRSLDKPVHTLFQVSTSRALVEGVYAEAVSSARLLQHGDFGLGTFDSLDGEMGILDGEMYQVRSDGVVRHVEENVGTPFATIITFSADEDVSLPGLKSFSELCEICDMYRKSENLFYAFRVDGAFTHVKTRAMRATGSGVSLKTAAAAQPEFQFENVSGTLVGFWSPAFAGAIDIPGYHFHFLSDDRTKGGHLLDCAAGSLRLRVQRVSDFHLSLPESEEFLRADLTLDLSRDLKAAEGNQVQVKR
jgi:acetolactate decarboxylase